MTPSQRPASEHLPPAAIVVIFGAGGDLTWRKLGPSLYDLFLDGWAPERLAVIGVGRKRMSDDDFRQRLRDGVDHSSRSGRTDPQRWTEFARNLAFQLGEFADPSLYSTLAERIGRQQREWGADANYIFYLATPPTAVEAVVKGLSAAGLARDHGRARIVVEKPIGQDLASARALNRSPA